MALSPTSKTALITGASAGIGLELAKLFGADGTNLVLVARRQDVLEEVKTELEKDFGIQVSILSMDLSLPGKTAELYNLCKAQGLAPDYLVNNAGYGAYGHVADDEPAMYENMLRLNVITLTELTALFVKDMVARGSGAVLNVGSLAAFLPLPGLNVYSASKSYVMHFTEALHAELKGTGVTATVLSPGMTETGFIARAKMAKSSLAKGGMMNAGYVAAAGYKAMMQGRLNAVPGLKNRILALTTGMVPFRNMRLAVASMIMKEKD